MTRTACRLAALASALVVLVPACDKKKPTDAGAGGDSSGDIPSRPGGPVNAGLTGSRLAALRDESKANLRQIGIAMHSHHDAVMFLPAGIADPAGKKVLLSWRVALLPYLEQNNLYKQ